MTPVKPLSLLCELTYRCNLQCPYCYNPLDLDGYRDELDAATWQRVIGEAADMGIVQLGFSGGEPTLRRDLAALIQTASARGLYTNLITQGTFLDDARIDELAGAGLDHIQISLQAPERELADAIAGTVVHERKLAAIARVQQSPIALTLNCVLHRNNHDTIADVIDVAVAFGVRKLELANVQFYGWAYRNRGGLMPTREQVERGLQIATDAKRRLAGQLEIVYVLPDYFERPAESVHARLGPSFHDGGAERDGDAVSRRRRHRRPALRQRPRPRLGGDLERVDGVHRLSRDGLDARSVPVVRPARDRLGRLPLPGLRAHRQRRGRRPGLRAKPRPRRHRSAAGDRRPPSDPRSATHARSRTGFVIVRVLGSAAGGGVPQWNCGCPNCAASRRGDQPRRTQSSLAVSADGERWVLLNVSPDIAGQIEAHPPLVPRGLRGTPIASILLTDANVDHLGGLVTLRQAGEHRFTIRSSAVVREIATAQPAFAPFSAAPHRWLAADEGVLPPADGDPVGTELTVRAIPVPGLTPGFAGRQAVRGAVTAFAVSGAGGATLLFAPVFAAVDAGLAAEIANADVAFLDGSFFTDDEMIVTGAGQKRATSLGHAPLEGANGTLAAIGVGRGRRFVTHVNNTNPILDPNSHAAAILAQRRIEVAADGLVLTL